MTEREVIARRAKAPRFLYLFTALFGLVFAGVAAWLGFTTGAPMGYLLIIFVLAGFFFTGISLFYFIKGMKTPEEIAVREGEMLTFLGQTFPLKELTNVRYRLAHYHHGWGGMGWFLGWGRLTAVRKDGRSYVAYFVADVEEAHDRLIALMREYAAKEEI